MMDLNDPRWKSLHGGYRAAYNPTDALHRLERDADPQSALDELWNELHHQGDVDTASYAALPHLARILRIRRDLGAHLYAMVATIEIERHRKKNPPIPGWMRESYENAWRELLDMSLHEYATATDPLIMQMALGVAALAKGLTEVGAIISHFDSTEHREILDHYMAWQELYSA